MNKKEKLKNQHMKLTREIEKKEARKLKARQRPREILFGLGMFGLIGWSVVVPTLLGLALGIWLDNRTETTISWTLTFFFAGLIIGCINAWYWMNKEGYPPGNNNEEEKHEDE